MLCACAVSLPAQQPSTFDPFEASIPELRRALQARQITCRQLVQWHLGRMEALDRDGPKFNAIRALNPQALTVADERDMQLARGSALTPLFCIPVVLKDNIDTMDMPTTGGTLALAASRPSKDAFLVEKLKSAGAIVLAKANLTELANFFGLGMPAGYSSLGGFVLNPFDPRPAPGADGRPVLSPGGSSSGPAVAVTANLSVAAVGTETSGSLLSPANVNSIVAIKPTVGLISRTGLIPLGISQDTAGPMARTVTDVAVLLGAMAGADPGDPATAQANRNPTVDYTPFLRADGLLGARIGVPRVPYWDALSAAQRAIVENAIARLRQNGAIVLDVEIRSAVESAELSSVIPYEFKRDFNAYLAGLGPGAQVRTLADLIAYNSANTGVALKYGQQALLFAQALDLDTDRAQYLADREKDLRLAKLEGLKETMELNRLDAMLFPAGNGADIGAKAGYPTVILPAGYLPNGAPYAISLLGEEWSEPKLITLAYAFEQATRARRIPGSAWRLLPVDELMRIRRVVNYASGTGDAIAPGEMIAISGDNLGPSEPGRMRLTPEGRVDTEIAGTRVLFEGVPGPMLAAGANSIITLVPLAVSGKSNVRIHIERNGRRSTEFRFAVSNTVPGIFTDESLGRGRPLVLNQDGKRNALSTPARRGSIITFFVTGEGLPATGSFDGRVNSAPLPAPAAPVVVGINHTGIQVLFAGAAPNLAGIMQVNALIPETAPTGAAVPLIVRVGNSYSQEVLIAIE